MPVTSESVAGALVLTRGALRVEICRHPFAVHVRRGGRRLIRSLGVWAVDGEVEDQFIQFTEGVIAREALELPERVVAASVAEPLADGALLAVRFEGGRAARLRITLPASETVLLELDVDGAPLRLAADWDGRAGEHFAGLGARHALRVDHAGREIQLGADRAYTGPDCPADFLADGGIPQGDYAPAAWLQSSRGYAVWVHGHGNGMRFELGDERTVMSARANAGPLRLTLLTDPTPAARLRRYLRACGLPPVLAEWGYGFWKSRDVYQHQDDVEDDVRGCQRCAIPLDAVVLDSPWETQYNTWDPNPHQFPDFTEMVRAFRDGGVRTVVWITPWVNIESADGQMPPGAESRALHRAPASNYAAGLDGGHYVRGADGEAFVAKWWMGTGSPIDFTSDAAEQWWRSQAKRALALGIEGIKADDGEGYYFPDDVRFADGGTGASAAWAHGGAYRRSMQRALDEVWGPNRGVLFGRSGWSGQQACGMLWGGDQVSDFWSLRVLVAASLSAAASGFSNWSHDVGGYLGHRLVERCPPELLVRWVQLGCFTPLMQAHARLVQEPWTYDERTLSIYRAYVLLHERLVPYVRAAALTAARCGLPIIRPLHLVDPADERGWSIADAFGYGPSLWVAPVLDEGARSREVALPRGDWIEAWSGERVRGGGEVVAPAPREAIPVWVREGSVVVTYPAAHVAAGLGDTPELQRPLEATLWGEPRLGSAAVRLADGTKIAWRRGRWSVECERDVMFAER
ncbi:MAG: alpha-D-xyloside xylohydrolase [Solirubrobacteraceae bacterium]|jgi:alpha-glucosidase (family GH31 glycosyl hydrolase)|nr:alpha-D-xyloside xylohydrolase [Solirubrobacteraceae bacterium]